MRSILSRMVLAGIAATTLRAEVSIAPTTHADHYGDSLRVVEDYLAHINRGYWVKYEDVTFDSQYSNVRIIHAGENDGGLLFVAGPLDGGIQMTNVCTTKATGDWHAFDTSTFEAVTPAEGGTHDVFVEFSLGGFFGEGVGNFRDFTFLNDTSDSSAQRYEPAAWGTTEKGSSDGARIITNLSATENLQQRHHEKTLAVYDVRGRTARILTGSHNAGLGNRRQGGAGQTLVIVPKE